jgi:formate--tetrahydrofolate ligase
MLAALIDNYNYFNKGTSKVLKQITWKRVLDVNDRSLRNIVTGLGGNAHGIPNETGFDITTASEIMAIFCLAKDLDDLRNRLDSILVGYDFGDNPVYVRDLAVGGALLVLLKDAFKPNLVQTTEHTPAIIHGGPFANIAHGCNSIVATKTALSLAPYVVTEAGFGSDLGAEKFLNIKCRLSGLAPALSVLVITSQSLKLHGGVDEKKIKEPSLDGIKNGLLNVERHIQALQSFGQSVLVAFNRFSFDLEEEIAFIRQWSKSKGADFCLNDGFLKGGEGAVEMAKKVVEMVEQKPSSDLKHTYELSDSIEEKLNKVVKTIYGGKGVTFTKNALAALKKIKAIGKENLPICIAKTQYSFSDNPTAYGVSKDFVITVENLVINSGAGFIVAVAGDIMRMPGLPKVPQALAIDYKDENTVGLS